MERQLNDDWHEYSGTVVALSKGGGILIDMDGDEVWLPKSQLDVNFDVNLETVEKGDDITFRLPMWLALERGLYDD